MRVSTFPPALCVVLVLWITGTEAVRVDSSNWTTTADQFLEFLPGTYQGAGNAYSWVALIPGSVLFTQVTLPTANFVLDGLIFDVPITLITTATITIFQNCAFRQTLDLQGGSFSSLTAVNCSFGDLRLQLLPHLSRCSINGTLYIRALEARVSLEDTFLDSRPRGASSQIFASGLTIRNCHFVRQTLFLSVPFPILQSVTFSSSSGSSNVLHLSESADLEFVQFVNLDVATAIFAPGNLSMRNVLVSDSNFSANVIQSSVEMYVTGLSFIRVWTANVLLISTNISYDGGVVLGSGSGIFLFQGSSATSSTNFLLQNVAVQDSQGRIQFDSISIWNSSFARVSVDLAAGTFLNLTYTSWLSDTISPIFSVRYWSLMFNYFRDFFSQFPSGSGPHECNTYHQPLPT